jgi:hypothetical protein
MPSHYRLLIFVLAWPHLPISSPFTKCNELCLARELFQSDPRKFGVGFCEVADRADSAADAPLTVNAGASRLELGRRIPLPVCLIRRTATGRTIWPRHRNNPPASLSESRLQHRTKCWRSGGRTAINYFNVPAVPECGADYAGMALTSLGYNTTVGTCEEFAVELAPIADLPDECSPVVANCRTSDIDDRKYGRGDRLGSQRSFSGVFKSPAVF